MYISEIFAAITILCPSIIGLYFTNNSNNISTLIASYGVMMHCPFSFSLHMYKAFGKNDNTRTLLYKLDVIFIHIHSAITGYCWCLDLQIFEKLFHLFCIINIIISNPIKYPKIKNTIDILTGLGVIKSSFGLIFINFYLWLTSIIFWTIAFSIHNKKLLGPHSSSIMHILISIPQFCILKALNN